MTPVDTYNAQADVDELIKGARTHKNLEVTEEALLLYGNGDGGGGPTALMLEKVRHTLDSAPTCLAGTFRVCSTN